MKIRSVVLREVANIYAINQIIYLSTNATYTGADSGHHGTMQPPLTGARKNNVSKRNK